MDKRTYDHPLFGDAIQAIGLGDVAALTELLDRAPELVEANGGGELQVQLIHYGSFNGTEKLAHTAPKTAPQITRLLIDRGAEVDALVRGKSWGTAMSWALSSWFTFEAGIQNELVDAYLDGGAAIEGVNGDGAPLGHAIGFGYTRAVEHLAQRGANVDHLIGAAALGDLERLQDWHNGSGFGEEAMNYPVGDKETTGRFSWPPACRADRGTQALITAATHGRAEVVAWLLETGVDPSGSVSFDQSALHFSAYIGHPAVVKLLLKAGAKRDGQDGQFGRTPSEWALETGERGLAQLIQPGS